MTAIISAEDAEWLARPHIARAWFGEFDLPSGLARLHNGTGDVTIGGNVWRGVSNPLDGRLVHVGVVEESTIGQAAAVAITLSVAAAAFIKSVYDTRDEIKGRDAAIYWAAFDQETQVIWPAGLVELFSGHMNGPEIHWVGIGQRVVRLSVESTWASQNFPPGGKWNDADQQRRYPGDLGFEYVGQKIQETWR